MAVTPRERDLTRPGVLFRRFYPESRFGGFSDVDGTIAFFLRVNALLEPDHTVLDVGCGRGAGADDPVQLRRELRTLRGKCARVIGIDVDAEAQENPLLDEFRKIESNVWPIEDESVDLCICDYVIEHIESPGTFFAEAARVLRSGGYLAVRTPNVRSYFGLFSRLVPTKLHAKVARASNLLREEIDVFPTVYRCNTRGKLTRQLQAHGFDGVVYTYDAEPTYLHFSGLAYRLGVLHQRHAPRAFKLSLVAFAKKP